MKQICGTCNNFYCGECTLKNKYTDALKNGCQNHTDFDKNEYRKRVKEMKENEEIQKIEKNLTNTISSMPVKVRINGVWVDIDDVNEEGEYI